MAAIITTGLDPFHSALRTRLEADLASLREALCSNMARDFLDYKFRCGTIVALQQVLDQCQEIETQMYGMREVEDGDAD